MSATGIPVTKKNKKDNKKSNLTVNEVVAEVPMVFEPSDSVADSVAEHVTSGMPTIIKRIKNIFFRPIFLLAYFVLLLFVSYHVIFAQRIIPGVVVGNVRVGGMTYVEAQKALQGINATNQTINLTYQDKTYPINTSDISLVYDWNATLARAFKVGRTGNFLIDAKDKIAGFIKPVSIVAYYDYNDETLSNKFSAIKAGINVDAANAAFAYKDGKLYVTPSNEGHKVVDDSLYNIVIGSFNSLDFSSKELPIKTVTPKIYDTDLTGLQQQAEKITANSMTISHAQKQWVLKPEQLLNFVTVTKDNGEVLFTIDDPKFQAFSDGIANDVNELPRGQVTSTDGNNVTGFEITQDGKALDDKQFEADFKNALFAAKPTLELPMKSVSGPASKEQYGILQLLGEGSSHFKGSIPGRIHNLSLAAERTNGVLVAPGAIYSLNNAIGEISLKTGYNTAYIISEGRTVLGEGGGVCQTSTTLFRAVLNSGLPVVMRYPHAYRVGYYEQDMPVGFDAAIFQPSWDFQFKNDTANYVLVQSEYNADEQSLTFRLYGTSDGRTVDIPKPLITNEAPPPPALYQDDPTLAKGTIKQVDFPAWGANVKLTRTVKKGDQVLYNDTFNSVYQPWRAVYLVGTK